MTGNLVDARSAYTEAVRISEAAGNIHMVFIAKANLAEILIEQGQFHQAAKIYFETLKMAALPDGQISPLAERAYAGLSRISYAWNRLETAAEYAHQCIELSLRWGSNEYQAIGYVVLAELEHGKGNPEKAQEAMRAAEQLIREYPLAPWRSIWVKSALARIWIAQGNWGRASELVQESGITMDGNPKDTEIPYLHEPVYFILLRLFLAQGNHEAALTLSERLLHEAETTNRMGQVIEILVIQALAFQGKKALDQSLAVLERAFTLAQPEEYVRVFLDEGEPMAKLLYQARSHRIGYALELLSAMGKASPKQPPAQLLIEPLSLRELEVLKLIETGCSNQEIAAKLVISIATVKRHISNIYAKLGVESRTHAVSMARELGLFE
jgi:LuxR family maltose regulon positive regulatory protein